MIDTLNISKSLRAEGFTERQTDALVDAFRQKEGTLATKMDIEGIRGELSVLKWLIGLSIALNGMAIAGVLAVLLK